MDIANSAAAFQHIFIVTDYRKTVEMWLSHGYNKLLGRKNFLYARYQLCSVCYANEKSCCLACLDCRSTPVATLKHRRYKSVIAGSLSHRANIPPRNSDNLQVPEVVSECRTFSLSVISKHFHDDERQ